MKHKIVDEKSRRLEAVQVYVDICNTRMGKQQSNHKFLEHFSRVSLLPLHTFYVAHGSEFLEKKKSKKKVCPVLDSYSKVINWCAKTKRISIL